MSNTTYSALPYPVASSIPNVPQDFSNLAAALDQKVIVTVASASARNALSSKYDNMIVLQADTDRHYRWNAAATRWDYFAGPWFTWTPTLTDSGGSPVTYGASGSARGTYIIIEGRIRFTASMLLTDPIDGRSGVLMMQMPSGVVAKTTDPTQDVLTCHLVATANSSHWMGVGTMSPSGTAVQPYFPTNSGTSSLGRLVNATSAGATGSGVPQIGGSYPLTNNSRFSCWGEYELSSWPAL